MTDVLRDKDDLKKREEIIDDEEGEAGGEAEYDADINETTDDLIETDDDRM